MTDQTLNEIVNQGEGASEEGTAATTTTTAAAPTPPPPPPAAASSTNDGDVPAAAAVPQVPTADVGSKRPVEEEGGEGADGAAKRAKLDVGGEGSSGEDGRGDAGEGRDVAAMADAPGAADLTAELMQGLAGGDTREEFKGLGVSGRMAEGVKTSHILDKCEELRVEIEGAPVVIVLETGHAEIFGAEMPKGEKIEISRSKFAIFTWQGCVISITGEPKVVYVGETTPMKIYANLHGFLQQERVKAHDDGSTRPSRTMIVGPACTGKTSLAKLLVNYAVRLGEKPCMVDLSLREGPFLMAGAIGAASVGNLITVNEEIEAFDPISYYYGYKEVGHHDPPPFHLFLSPCPFPLPHFLPFHTLQILLSA